MNEERGKECSGVSERYNIPGHSTPVPKCTCCMCCYLHARLSDTPEFARAAICTRVMFGYSRVPIWDIDGPGFATFDIPKGNSGVSEHHARASSSTCKLGSIRKSRVQIAARATRALWDRCGVARYIILFGDSRTLFSSISSSSLTTASYT